MRKNFNYEIYSALRIELIQNSETGKLLPRHIKTCRTEGELWAYFKNQFSHYHERRKCISEEFSALLEHLELIDLNENKQTSLDLSKEFVSEERRVKMYNLIVSVKENSWNGSPFGMIKSRFGEHTEPKIIDQFNDLDDKAIAQLISLPTIFAVEGSGKTIVKLGPITDLKLRNTQIGILYEIDEKMPPITWSQLNELEWELDIDPKERTRHHWAIKEIDLFRELLRAGLISLENINVRKFLVTNIS